MWGQEARGWVCPPWEPPRDTLVLRKGPQPPRKAKATSKREGASCGVRPAASRHQDIELTWGLEAAASAGGRDGACGPPGGPGPPTL